MIDRAGKFRIGQVVRHRLFPFRGVVFDVDPTFANTEEWWLAIPEDVRPRRDQPYYHLLAENAETTYVAYVSEQNLLPDADGAILAARRLDEALSQPRSRECRESQPTARTFRSRVCPWP